MTDITIYHNPRCSKSRQTLQLIEDTGVEPRIVKYLDDVPSEAELSTILKKLAVAPREMMRIKEADYKDNQLADESLTEQQLIAAMHQFPKVIERPIVVRGEQAVIGRPPENVLALLK